MDNAGNSSQAVDIHGFLSVLNELLEQESILDKELRQIIRDSGIFTENNEKTDVKTLVHFCKRLAETRAGE